MICRSENHPIGKKTSAANINAYAMARYLAAVNQKEKAVFFKPS
jgi:hypothetical protein